MSRCESCGFGDSCSARPGLLATARTSHAEHPLHPASFPARCGSGAGLTRRRRDVARGHADHRADARREGRDRVTARGPRQHRGGSGRRTHGRASRWPHPTSAKVCFGATAPQLQLPEAVRHCAAVCCCRAVVAAAVQAVAAEAKTRSNWRPAMTQIATKYVADPHKYGGGSGYGGRGACADRYCRP